MREYFCSVILLGWIFKPVKYLQANIIWSHLVWTDLLQVCLQVAIWITVLMSQSFLASCMDRHLKLLSWNLKGLNHPIKRKEGSSHLKKTKQNRNSLLARNLEKNYIITVGKQDLSDSVTRWEGWYFRGERSLKSQSGGLTVTMIFFMTVLQQHNSGMRQTHGELIFFLI